MSKEIIKVPDIGSSDPVDVIELLVKVGDTLAQDDSLLVLESAKASVEVPSPVAGKVLALKVKVGDRVKVGDDLMEVEAGANSADEPAPAPNVVGASPAGESVPDALEAKASLARQAPTVSGNAPALVGASPAGEFAPTQSLDPRPAAKDDDDMVKDDGGMAKDDESVSVGARAAGNDDGDGRAPVHAGPAVRKLARQLGVDLAQVTASSGQHQRILKEDVYALVATRLQQPAGVPVSLPDIDFAQFGEIERVATTNLKRTAGRHLQQSWQQVPQVTQHDLADITELEAFRKAENQRNPQVKLTLLAFVARAVVAALREFPHFNASLSSDGSELILKRYIHLGFAVDSDRGLLVPVLKNADRLGVGDIAKGIADLADKARSRKLLPAEMQGASFTLSSLGGIGGTAFTPLVNHPEVAILGLSRADWQPVWQARKEKFKPRLMLPLSLSYDHRVIDGADAARFVVFLREQLTDLRRLLL